MNISQKELDELLRLDKKTQSDRVKENVKRSLQLTAIRHRCEKTQTPFDIKHKDLDWPTHCPILGIELTRSSLTENRDNSPSIDKIIPELGYVKGNVRVISSKANRMKNNATRAELEMFCKNILDYMDGKI